MCVWKKRGILFTFPYWVDQKLCHNIDVMHTEKNVIDNIMATLLDLDGKTKDTYQARLDLKAMGIRSELHLVHKGVDTVEMPAACYNMTTSEKDDFLQVLKDLRVPNGYALNISRRVHLKERKIFGLKSHDDHILVQQLLPIALCGSLPLQVTRPLIKSSCYFREIFSKKLTVPDLENLEKDIAVTLCKLEKIFPPSFFTVMVHLVMHLAREAKLGGLVHYRWMYPIESIVPRYLSRLKSYMRNKATPEGSIAEGYIVEECLTFCSRYMHGIETIVTRPIRTVENSTGVVSYFTLGFQLCRRWTFSIVKTKVRDVFDAGSGPMCDDDDGDTYCENVPYNITADNVVSDNISLARAGVQGTTIDAILIAENEKQEGDFIDDNDFIDDEVSDEDYSDNEYCTGMGRKRRLEFVELGESSSSVGSNEVQSSQQAPPTADDRRHSQGSDDETQSPATGF
uniref:DUF4218 domain-containing protein n=1 Tax=Quercus lobata TaxID=97700 RepID=A0A7N2N0X3_QUELO